MPLTPKGNATERHICEAYERKAVKTFPDKAALAAFWKEKLGDCPADSVKLQALIRSKTMKRGGIKLILVEPYFDLKTPEAIARDTGGKVAKLMPSVGGVKEIGTYFQLFDYDINLLVTLFQEGK